MRWPPASKNESHHTPCAIRLPPIFSKGAPISAPCNQCSVMRISRRRKFTPTSTAQDSRRFTGDIIQERGAAGKATEPQECWSDGILEYWQGPSEDSVAQYSILPSFHYSKFLIASLSFSRACRIHVQIARDGFDRHHPTNCPVGCSRPNCDYLSRSISWLGCLPVRGSYRRENGSADAESACSH